MPACVEVARSAGLYVRRCGGVIEGRGRRFMFYSSEGAVALLARAAA